MDIDVELNKVFPEAFRHIALITGRNEVVAKVMFTGVCHSFCSQGGLRRTPPGRTPPDQTRQTPRTKETPPGTRENPPDQGDSPGTRENPPGPGRSPPWKQTPAYGLRAAGTHPAGMHSCLYFADCSFQ